MLAFYVDSSACKNIPVRPETNFARPEATRDFILKGTNGPEDGNGGDERKERVFRWRRLTTQRRRARDVFLSVEVDF